MTTFSCKDAWYASLAAVILLTGTVTGSGIAMFVTCAIALALMLVFDRKQLRSKLLIALWAAVIGIGIFLALVKILPVDLLH